LIVGSVLILLALLLLFIPLVCFFTGVLSSGFLSFITFIDSLFCFSISFFCFILFSIVLILRGAIGSDVESFLIKFLVDEALEDDGDDCVDSIDVISISSGFFLGGI
jgi:hypothetical protein